jgi:fructosamine-3-kinase
MSDDSNRRVDLERIWEAHRLGTVWTVTTPRRGGVNRCFIVNEDLVIRFNGWDTGACRFRNEQVAFASLRPSGVPVPQVVALDDSRTLVSCDYLIATRLVGETIIDSWSALLPAERWQLACEAGRWQAVIHGHCFERYGSLNTMPYGGFPSWSAYLDDYFERYARQNRDLGTLDEPTLARIYRLLERHRAMFDGVTTAALLHSDYHFENILQQGGHVTGIIDFEWAHTGDPAFDCRIDPELDATCPGSVEPFYQGYQTVRPLPEDHALKARIYRLLLHVENLADSTRQSQPEWRREEQRELVDRLDSLESRDGTEGNGTALRTRPGRAAHE